MAAAKRQALAELIGLGEFLLARARPEGALRCFDFALAHDDRNPRAHRGRGRALFRSRRPREALRSFLHGVDLGADPARIAGESWASAMLVGDFETAWRISDLVLARRSRAELNRRDQPFHLRYVWDGTPLAARDVLVRCYHGAGDTIQFIRFAPIVRRLARSLTVQADRALHRLLAGCAGIDRLTTLAYDASDPPYEVDIELMELPHALRTTLATIPAEIPYLRLPTPTAGRDGRFRVGLAWRAGEWDRHRSIPLSQLRALGEIPGVVLVNLQRGPGLAELDGATRGLFGNDPATWTDEWTDTAQTIATLDLVIAVDTAVAHLAGALGVPVWTLLHEAADWRWMIERDDTPWYPTMRLFRQRERGAWGPVVAAVTAALRHVANTSPAKDAR